MSTRFWRRLAGCIAIECCLSAAPRPEYRAGAAVSEHARAVALEDRRGYRAVFAEADFPITREISDFVAVQLVKAGGLDRAGIVITGSGPAAPDPLEIIGAVAQALLGLDAAAVEYAGIISIRPEAGGCLATLYPIRLDGCRDGVPAHGPIRAAFQMVDVPHPLQTRAAPTQAYPVQAIAVGKSVTILALGGNAPAARFASPARLIVTGANDSAPPPPDAVIDAAVSSVLRRVR